MGSVLAEISLSDLDTPPPSNATITGLQHIASYNWLEGSVPTISVPGSPPLWSPPRVAPKLTPDSGMVYIDQNAARSPRYPLEPLFRALQAENPDFELGDIDLVTDRNNIRKLLRFVQGSSSDNFEIRVEIAGDKTALFTRVEIKTKDIIQDFRGFGHNFEKAYTKGIPGSTGHHRIVHYLFGGMKCLIRHETDGFIESKVNPDSIPQAAVVFDGVLDLLGAVSISETGKPTSKQLVTVMNRMLDMADVTPQLWISQTPTLVIGYHQYHMFNNVQMRNVKQEIQDWETANQTALRKLALLIKKISQVVGRSSDRNAIVKYNGGTKLTVTSGKQERALPEDLYLLWDVKKQGADDDMVQDRGKAIDESHTKSLSSVPGLGHIKRDTNDIAGSGQPSGGVSAPLPTHDTMPFSDIVDHAVQDGLRQVFRRMSTSLSDYQSLCETLKSRGIDVLAGRNLRDIMKDLRKGKDDWDPDERREIKGFKSLARDSAFRLFYIFILDLRESGASDQNMAYNATTFVISHRRIFKYKTRKMVRQAFEMRYSISYNQRKGLDKWPIDNPSRGNEEEEEDVTTEEEDIYSSDWSF
ncbi:hypothetical protein TRIATDRAFT_290144 [Trichoderma atroviride IMI 206040]|uniref:Geranylgeranyl pyrophosphate synthetase n=2 Tax=Hypocrea atroviridis TaxID=63577 RepID=G9NKL9_HYPAI|nr:uncharacterized protein TRIATDRAFT_290144 [Trichoderma atroviride IMI 206040]EHK48442.1 hypothetical protein TRIATDRAFT_290144 [Trichoderma atroviride IMI 206040]